MAAAAIVLAGATVHAQLRRPKADITPVTDADGVHAGEAIRVALRVNLPAGFHVQSDKPRDPSLIPTVLTLNPPRGVGATEIVYPRPTDLPQAGQRQPLAVFEEAFAIGVRLTIDPTLPVGDIIVPVRLRYQACDASSCYAPTSETAQWTLHVVPAEARTSPTFTDVFEPIRFGTPPVSPASRP
jgi:DsbC/DsbD-like thiol-disulfide interchange protein